MASARTEVDTLYLTAHKKDPLDQINLSTTHRWCSVSQQCQTGKDAAVRTEIKNPISLTKK
uniref:Uncharacterized protein n=1 Tax=Arundo donax TaxID=35708 RepID=A0A0A9SZI0_ARUDO